MACWLTLGWAAPAEISDPTVSARLARIYAAIPNFEAVRASVQEGVVTLSGTILNAALRDDAVALAAEQEGVIYVVDELEQETDVGRTLTPALARLQNYLGTALRYSPLLLVAAALIGVFGLLAWLVGRLPLGWLRANALLEGLLRQLLRAALALVGLLLALDLLGATAIVTAVLGTAGLAGLAVGFAFRDIVENYLAGVLLSLRQPFAIGDHLLLGTHEGRVVRLTSRELVLMTLDGNQVRVPNSLVFSSVTTNFTRNPRRRFEFEVSVSAAEDLDAVRALGLRALRALPGVLDEPKPQLRVQALAEGVTLRVLGWVDQRQADFLKVRSEALALIKETFERAGVQPPESVTKVQVQRQGVPPAPPVASAAVTLRPERLDVAPDEELDAQLAEELADPDEPNLLEPRQPYSGSRRP